MKNYYIAATYGSGSYDSATYGGNTTSSTGTSGTGTTGQLADTGFGVLAFVTVACLIIFVALLVRFWRRKPVAPRVDAGQFYDNLPPQEPR